MHLSKKNSIFKSICWTFGDPLNRLKQAVGKNNTSDQNIEYDMEENYNYQVHPNIFKYKTSSNYQ